MNGVTDYLDKFQCDDNTTSSTADQYRSYLIVNGICYCSSGKNPRAAVRSWSSFKARMCVGLVVRASEFEPSLELICVCERMKSLKCQRVSHFSRLASPK
jgi:hypothetical protein